MQTNGSIDISGVNEDVDIYWTIDDDVNRTFRTDNPPGAISITNPDGGAPPDGLFGAGELSGGNKTLKVSDANTVGSNPTGDFQYTLRFNVETADPTIRNR